MEETQKYMALKTKTFIEESCLGRLKKTEGEGNSEWFCRTAKDHKWPIPNCKKAMDKTWQHEREQRWSVAEDPNTKENANLRHSKNSMA